MLLYNAILNGLSAEKPLAESRTLFEAFLQTHYRLTKTITKLAIEHSNLNLNQRIKEENKSDRCIQFWNKRKPPETTAPSLR